MLSGAHLPLGGWTYAVDFPAEYQPKKGFTSCVRRRRWIRHRRSGRRVAGRMEITGWCLRYVAVNAWSSVPGLGREEQEPFIDCSAGGEELEEGELQVEDVYLIWQG